MTQEIEDWEWHENRELESKVPNVTQFPIIEEKNSYYDKREEERCVMICCWADYLEIRLRRYMNNEDMLRCHGI